MFSILASLTKRKAVQTLEMTLTSSANAEVAVVFVHGLNGDPIKTWGFDRSPNWMTWIAEHFGERVSVSSIGYNISTTWWKKGSMSIQDRSTNLLSVLEKRLDDNIPIVFVCHSYGGLLFKNIYRMIHDYANLTRFKERIAGVLFIATPHRGSKAANFVGYAGRLWRPTHVARELQLNDPVIADLNLWFRNNSELFHANNAGILKETLSTHGLLIVDDSSSDPGITGVVPVAVDADHIDICKPKSAYEVQFLALRRILANVMKAKRSSCGAELNETLEKLRHCLSSGEHLDTHDFEVLEKFKQTFPQTLTASIAALQQHLTDYASIPRGIGQAIYRKRSSEKIKAETSLMNLRRAVEEMGEQF
ncbi:esterase/lipase family protein [Agrobacterium pusense]|uniref:esterase/lipase family protein n=1 Tax=Agrobacterium pusense TaxID=648995 RepID=UPI00241506BE|nr:hypothetical protein [Agrobacterium pusense]WFN87248.1 hypothetical protein P9K39_13010 [Agrobacterium pusense]